MKETLTKKKNLLGNLQSIKSMNQIKMKQIRRFII